MGKRELRELLNKEAAAAEAARGQDQDAPLPDHVTVTRPNRARSKVLQVRLSPEEYQALERLAESRDLPISAIARARLLGLLDEQAEGDPLQRLINAARDFALDA